MAAGTPPPKPWERGGASSAPGPFNPPSGGSTFDVVEAFGTAKHGQIVASNISSNISCQWQGSYEGSNLPPKPWERAGASYGPAPFKPRSTGNISDLVEACRTIELEEMFSATWNSVVSNANSNISRPFPPRLWQQQGYGNSYGGSNPPPKPWEIVGASCSPAPFKPPSEGSTVDVVEASGTAGHGEIVSGTWNSIAYNVNSIISRPVPPRLWQQQGCGNSYGGYGSSMCSSYGRFSAPNGNNRYSDYGGCPGTTYGGYGGLLYNSGTGGPYGVYGTIRVQIRLAVLHHPLASGCQSVRCECSSCP